MAWCGVEAANNISYSLNIYDLPSPSCKKQNIVHCASHGDHAPLLISRCLDRSFNLAYVSDGRGRLRKCARSSADSKTSCCEATELLFVSLNVHVASQGPLKGGMLSLTPPLEKGTAHSWFILLCPNLMLTRLCVLSLE